jgi:hypothetical protein
MEGLSHLLVPAHAPELNGIVVVAVFAVISVCFSTGTV